VFELPATITISSVENFNKKVSSQEQVDELLLPGGASKHAFGGIAAAFQAVCTWSRHSNNGKLLIKKSVDNREIEKIIQQPHKFSAAMLTKSIHLVDKEKKDIRYEVNLSAKNAVENQAKNAFGQHHGRLCWFAFVDHSTKGLDRNFYIESEGGKPEIRQPEQIQAVMASMVNKSILVAGGSKNLSKKTLAQLGRIFYELFKNTHEHGTKAESKSEWLRPGVRLIYSYGINLSDSGTDGSLGEEPILSKYVDSVRNLRTEKNKNLFIEISIGDSGLGFCRRWLSDHGENQDVSKLSMKEEYQIFRKCFTFRQTSTKKATKGHGLPVVMDRISELKGFMRVRSGRLSLYRDFLASPYSHKDQCHFSDWKTHSLASQQLTEEVEVEGVTVTLLIPLESK